VDVPCHSHALEYPFRVDTVIEWYVLHLWCVLFRCEITVREIKGTMPFIGSRAPSLQSPLSELPLEYFVYFLACLDPIVEGRRPASCDGNTLTEEPKSCRRCAGEVFR
jgi:hypothetical protein